MSAAREGESATGDVPRDGRIRVLVAEDSTTVRRLLVALFASDPAFEVVGEVTNGADAVAEAVALRPDLITMDVQMPLMDGLDATKAIMREAPTPILIVSAAASRADAGLSFSAMQAGALMVVPKPEPPAHPDFEAQRAQFLGMARAMAGVKVVRRWQPGGVRPSRATLRPTGRRGARPQCLALAASTGGPAALRRILDDLPRDLPVPVLVVQHMARGFMDGLAAWLGASVALRVVVPRDGDAPVPGTVYLAPDDRHLALSDDGRVALLDTAAVGGFRPAADVLFDAVARVHGASAVAAILTGMGRDGVDGLAALHAAGGRVLAQDEATSVVYGMAQEAVRAGVVDEILPLPRLGHRLAELVAPSKSAP